MRKAYYVRRVPAKSKTYTHREKENNYLKNWRIVRYYIQKKYDINIKELEILLYLYDMGIFDRKDVNEYARICSWGNNTTKMFLDKGLFKMWRKGSSGPGNRDLLELSQRAKLICNHTYKKLNGEEEISENPYRNEIFKETTQIDKAYKKLIKKMNATYHASTES
ncbi:MAG: hypothetical protein Unbinned6046contig1000_61 [Prokaryotic dsDNA virus sp.]|nr:MAG: hypothetical protein Unbinned6046contig1000_61 [Prokaryotic dsDNA virus sp.]|tara:strand:- start:6594 stop:7088 length:495 start_codon:yes stop_codon:yes gene_type:complete